jgi:acyl carrier protein
VDRAARIREKVRALLAARGDSAPFADADSLVVSGRLASIDLLELVVALEQDFGIDFAERGFDANDFDSVRAIVALLDSARVR